MDWSDFKRGDIVRWKAYGQEFKFHYGLVIGVEEFSEYHHYEFPFDDLEPGYDMSTGLGYIPLRYEHVSSITVFSFSEQKKRIIYQSSLEVPYMLELMLYDFMDDEDFKQL